MAAVLRNMLHLPNLLTLSIARPALRIGGEWAGWCCAFNAKTGALITSDVEKYCSDTMIEWGQIPGGFEECTTETWEGDSLTRRTVRLLPEDGCNTENLAAIVKCATLPAAHSGTMTLKPGAAQLDTDVLNSRAWALDAADGEGGMWRCEAIFDGLGGPRPKELSGAVECPSERTRVRCSFNPTTGELTDNEPVLIWQERCWSARPSDDFSVREGVGSRSGIDAAWLSSVIGIGCFGEQKASVASPPDDARDDGRDASPAPLLASFGGGVELRGGRGLLEVCLRTAPGGSQYWSELRLKRSWAGGTIFVESEVVDDVSDKMRRDQA